MLLCVHQRLLIHVLVLHRCVEGTTVHKLVCWSQAVIWIVKQVEHSWVSVMGLHWIEDDLCWILNLLRELHSRIQVLLYKLLLLWVHLGWIQTWASHVVHVIPLVSNQQWVSLLLLLLRLLLLTGLIFRCSVLCISTSGDDLGHSVARVAALLSTLLFLNLLHYHTFANPTTWIGSCCSEWSR